MILNVISNMVDSDYLQRAVSLENWRGMVCHFWGKELSWVRPPAMKNAASLNNVYRNNSSRQHLECSHDALDIGVDNDAYDHLELLCGDKTLGSVSRECGRTVELFHTNQDLLLRWLWRHFVHLVLHQYLYHHPILHHIGQDQLISILPSVDRVVDCMLSSHSLTRSPASLPVSYIFPCKFDTSVLRPSIY